MQGLAWLKFKIIFKKQESGRIVLSDMKPSVANQNRVAMKGQTEIDGTELRTLKQTHIKVPAHCSLKTHRSSSREKEQTAFSTMLE